MISALKRLFRRVFPRPSPHMPEPAGIPSRSRRWDQSKADRLWFERPDALKLAVRIARRHNLGEAGEEWLRQWVKDGYFVVDGAVDVAKVQRYAEDFDRLWWQERPIPGLEISDVTIGGRHHVHIAHENLLAFPEDERREAMRVSNWRVGEFYLSSEAAAAVYRDDLLRRISTALMGRLATPHFSLSFSKGSLQALHQDTCVFHVWPRNALVGVWIAAEEIQADSGPLEFYPGSHREPLFGAFDNYPQTQRRTAPPEVAAAYDRYVTETATKYPRQTFLAHPGDALFWHGMLIHGGSAISNPQSTRKSMVVHFLPEGANRAYQIEGPFNW